MPEVGALLALLARRLDARLLPAAYAAVSVSPEHVRSWLRQRRLPFVDPEAPGARLADVDRTADHVIAQTRATTAAIGAVGGVGGWVTAPSEATGWMVACLRLAQRLAVVYGFDPRTDRGHAALSRALAAGFGTELPERGLSDLKVSDLVREVTRASPPAVPPRVGTRIARVVVARSARRVLGRIGRLVPVVASGIGAGDNHREAAVVGNRMKQVLRRLADVPERGGTAVEALEIVHGRPR